MNQEKRLSPRFNLQLPVTLLLPALGLKIQGKTRDISADGIFFYANFPLEQDEEVVLVLTLPPNELSPAPLEVRCRAKILRQESAATGEAKGMAATIQISDFSTQGSVSDEMAGLPWK